MQPPPFPVLCTRHRRSSSRIGACRRHRYALPGSPRAFRNHHTIRMRPGRIVITGVGAVSPNGIGRENYFAATAAGRSGISRITSFDPARLPARVAGEIVDFDPTHWVDAKNLKHVSRVVPLAIAATDEALRDAQLDPRAADLETRRRMAVML